VEEMKNQPASNVCSFFFVAAHCSLITIISDLDACSSRTSQY
jgi:hypothetical protein